MCPVYAVLAAPLARPLGVPVALWYTHWNATRTLRAAERIASVVLSVDRRSFPLDSRKVRALGHGIDLREFPCAEPDGAGPPLRALALGRYSAAKGLDTVVGAVALAPDVRLTVHGPAGAAHERQHHADLERLVAELGVQDRVELGPPVARAEVPALLAHADVLVNNMRAGAPDKVVYEAAASCRPVLASNPVFDAFLPDELRFPREDPEALAARFRELAARGDRAELGRTLRERVQAGHSVDSWADGVLAALS
jgi:glycosyltransferase involved in cell wall biosynthesis